MKLVTEVQAEARTMALPETVATGGSAVHLTLPGGGPARCNPVSAPEDCDDSMFEGG